MIKHVIISGRVQGVGFRHFTRKNADELGINGWVKNRDDGKVEAVFSGKEKDVNTIIERCAKGPVYSFVKEIKEIDSDFPKEEFTQFEVQL